MAAFSRMAADGADGAQVAAELGMTPGAADVAKSRVMRRLRLVALQDGRPVPKVIDFGTATATGDPLTDRSLATELGQAISTPGYMAPEQTGLDDLDVATRADVDALGVVLYELLVGSPRFSRNNSRERRCWKSCG